MRGTTIYAKNSGVEIKAATAVKTEDNGAIRKEGRVQMRFFTFGNGQSKSVRFILNPAESFGLCAKACAVVKNGNKASTTHIYENGKRMRSDLIIEKWEKEVEKIIDGKKQTVKNSGYALIIKRGEADEKKRFVETGEIISINVPVSESDLLFTAELLRALSIEQSWSSYKTADGHDKEDDAVSSDKVGAPIEVEE